MKFICDFQVYMFYGLSSGPCVVPDSVNVLPLDDANLPATPAKAQTQTDRPAASQKSRRPKNKRNKSKSIVVETASEANDEDVNEVDGVFNRLGVHDDGSTGFWAALGSSDSEFSDIEHGSSFSVSRGKRNSSSAQVRLYSLACFHAFIKVCHAM